MEDEAFSLFIVHTFQELPVVRDDKGRDLYNCHLVIKRATLRKTNRLGADVIFKRVTVDFDPMSQQSGYVIVAYTYVESPRVIEKRTVHFITVTKTEAEANEVVSKLSNPEIKTYLKGKEKLDRIEVWPVLITEA